MAGSRLEVLKQIATALSTQFGSDCEIVIHDLARNSIDNSVIHIENGHVTGRKVGSSPSTTVLEKMRVEANKVHDHLAYITKTDDGRILKSSTIFVKDDDEEVRYILEINYDITNLLALESTIKKLTTVEEHPDGSEMKKSPTQYVNTLLDELIEQSVALVGHPVSLMTKEDKIKAINYLNDAGAFLITKSGDKVAKYFGISKYTLYSYVDINKT